MLQPLPQAFADILSKYKYRPFDAAIKETLREPGVLNKLWDKHCKEAATLAFTEVKGTHSLPTAGVSWLDQEFRTKQATWRADMVARVGKSQIIHIEQQTQHKALEAARRMMLYASQIASHFDFKKTVLQLYYYTGDGEFTWKSSTSAATVVETSRGAISSKFLVLDAGSHDAEGMLETGDFNYAVLGLLSRKIADERTYVRKLVRLARDQFDSTEAAHKLVHCMTIAFLRKRAELVWRETTVTERNNMRDDPFWRQITSNDNRDTRRLCAAICRQFEALKVATNAEFPTAFLEAALEQFEWSDVDC